MVSTRMLPNDYLMTICLCFQTMTFLFTFLSPGKCLQVACGHSHSLALVQNEESGKENVYAWGLGSSGQLGLAKEQLQDRESAEVLNSYETSWKIWLEIVETHLFSKPFSPGSESVAVATKSAVGSQVASHQHI